MSDTPAEHGFIRLDNRLITDYAPRIGANALTVYLVLKLHENQKTGRCFPSLRRLCHLSKLSRPTVLQATRTLEEEGLIKVERKRTTGGKPEVNRYTLLPVGKSALLTKVNDVDRQGQAALPEPNLINKTEEKHRARAQPTPARHERAPSPAHPPSQPTRDPNLDHLAVKAYRGVCKLTPNEAQRAAIAEVVTDPGRWQEVMRKWLLAGYRASNVDGMLDWYKHGIPERTGANGRSTKGGRSGFQGGWAGEQWERRQPDTPDEIARRDAEWQKLVRESESRN